VTAAVVDLIGLSDFLGNRFGRCYAKDEQALCSA
jgi:hypothetical protein